MPFGAHPRMKIVRTTYFSIGSNVGNRLDHLQAAVDQLAAHVGHIVRLSSVYRSSSWGYQGGEYLNMLEAGIDVLLDGNPKSMHHKVIIIDDEIVVTGSYNFSKSAKTRNDENTLILFDREIAGEFENELTRVRKISASKLH